MFEDRHLYLLFTPELCVGSPWNTLEAALRGGVDLVQWRTPSRRDPDGARRCAQICAAFTVPLILNDHVELVAELADEPAVAGAHVGQNDLPADEARRILGPDLALGVSTHSIAEFDAALEAGADHVGFGPMFATETKGYRQGQPEGALRDILARSTVTVFPIGGITVEGCSRLRAEGADRAAVSAAILRADDPEHAATAFRSALTGDAPTDR